MIAVCPDLYLSHPLHAPSVPPSHIVTFPVHLHWTPYLLRLSATMAEGRSYLLLFLFQLLRLFLNLHDYFLNFINSLIYWINIIDSVFATHKGEVIAHCPSVCLLVTVSCWPELCSCN